MKALITWASSWFGAEFARQLAEKWYDLILVARSADKLKAISWELSQKYSINATYFVADLWNTNWIQSVMEDVIDKEDIDLLINNAGRWNLNWLLQSSFEDLREMMTLNMFNMVFLSQKIINKWIIEKKPWKIINVASIASFLFDWVFPLYSATKSFARNISYGFDNTLEDIAPYIKIQCLCPWLSKTNFMGPEFTNEQLDSFWFMEASDVVRESITALDINEFLVIPWEKNKESVKFFQTAPIEEIRKINKEFAKNTGLHF
jgi:short-subunit dehydrogenase